MVCSKDMDAKEAYHQLNKNGFYQSLTHNPTESLTIELRVMLIEAKENEFRFLYNGKSTNGFFLYAPKIHKCVAYLPGRPVVSDSGSLTEPVSKYIVYFIKPYLPLLLAS